MAVGRSVLGEPGEVDPTKVEAVALRLAGARFWPGDPAVRRELAE